MGELAELGKSLKTYTYLNNLDGGRKKKRGRIVTEIVAMPNPPRYKIDFDMELVSVLEGFDVPFWPKLTIALEAEK